MSYSSNNFFISAFFHPSIPLLHPPTQPSAAASIAHTAIRPLPALLCCVQPSHKTFKIKKILAKKQRQNRPIPQWIRLRTDNTVKSVHTHTHAHTAHTAGQAAVGVQRCSLVVVCGLYCDGRYNSKRRHWRRTKLGI